VSDERSGRVVFLSHCLLNNNVRYIGGAEREAGVRPLVDRYLADGVGICQMPCLEQRAWGGVLKRRMLIAYGAGGTWRSPLVRAIFSPFMAYTRRVYQRLARDVAAEIADYQDSGFDVIKVIGIAGSPSCGVHTTLDLPAALDVLDRCPLANLDRRMINEQVIRAHTRTGQGLFVTALRRQWVKRGVPLHFGEYDFAETSQQRRPAAEPPRCRKGDGGDRDAPIRRHPMCSDDLPARALRPCSM
jgi:predicted secreted protein